MGGDSRERPDQREKRKIPTIVTICTFLGLFGSLALINFGGISIGDGRLSGALGGAIIGAVGGAGGVALGYGLDWLMKRRRKG